MTMTCEINSSPPATIRWTLFADPVPEDMYTMMTSSKSQLTIQSADYVNVGKYFCIASNQLLNKIQYSLPAELTVVGMSFACNFNYFSTIHYLIICSDFAQ